MRTTKKIAIGMLLTAVFSFFTPTVWASLLNSSKKVSAEYMKTTHDSDIYAAIGDKVITVGIVKEGQLLRIMPVVAEYREFKFGNGTGFISKDDITEVFQHDVKREAKLHDTLGELNKPSVNQNLLSLKPIPIHDAPNTESPLLAVLNENLRYPIQAKLKNKENHTWYEVNFAGRLGYISEEDAELDQGIPVLTFHHLLNDSENKSFRHTSTTTSDVAFKEQMSYLHEQGYETITGYQLQSYLNNQINLPAKVMMLTFDDGLTSVYRYAYPVLKELGMHASAFIISSRIKYRPQPWNPNGLQFMSVSQLEDIRDVFDIQSHSHFLHRMDNKRRPILLSRSLHNITIDLERSRRGLMQFNPHPNFFAYPFGAYNQNGIDGAKAAGFTMAFTTVQGKVKLGDNPYTLKRLYILRTDSVESMMERISNSNH